MLNKIAIATLAIGLTVTSAHAEYYRRYENHHYYNHGGGGNWVAPLVGGLIIGGMLGAISEQQQQQQYYNQYQPICRDVVVGYDLWNRPVFQRVCQ